MPASTQNIDRFIESLMSAVGACGVIHEATRNHNQSTTTARHRDRCEVIIPDECMREMSDSQLAEAFTPEVLQFLRETAAGIFTSAPAQAAPADSPAAAEPAVTFEAGRYAQTQRSLDQYTERIRYAGYDIPFAVPSRNATSRAVRERRTAHSDIYRRLMQVGGVVIPQGVSDMMVRIFDEATRNWVDKINRLQSHVDTMNRDYETQVNRWRAKVDASKQDALAARADADKLTRLRDAALAWRDAGEVSAAEKFTRFNNLMVAIDSTATAPVAPEVLEEVIPETLAPLAG